MEAYIMSEAGYHDLSVHLVTLWSSVLNRDHLGRRGILTLKSMDSISKTCLGITFWAENIPSIKEIKKIKEKGEYGMSRIKMKRKKS